MPNVLERIVADKRDALIGMKASLSEETIRAGLTPSEKSLFDALSAPNAGFILECKKASPSKGLIRDPFDLKEILAAYAPYAAAISVLTDEKYFQGSYENLAYVTSNAAQPVLNKDFFIEPYQVYLARYYQADAILLMLSVLDDETYRELAEVAASLQLDVLTEVSNEEEMHRAIALKAPIIGINNRNLRDLSTDLAATEKLIPILENATHDFVTISESGIYTHQDVRRLAPLVDGFLVGSALMAQQDLPLAVQNLVMGGIKVCGMTSASDARAARDGGASYLGLIFADKSPRCVSKAQALDIVNTTPARYVGVFVDESAAVVAELANTLALSAVQLHGSEDETYRAQLRALLPEHCAIWQAVGVTDALPPQVATLLEEDNVNAVLLDCQIGKQSGGTGKQFDWSLLESLNDKSKIILAGGITPDSAADALATGASIIDVNSGAEDAPGKKSVEKLGRLFANCRQY